MTNTSGNGSLPPGWHRDAQGTMRWWDGSSWTEQTQPPPPPAYGAAASAKDPWWKKKWVWAVAVVVIIAAAASAGGGGSDGSDGEDTAADNTSTSQTAPSADPDDAEESEPPADVAEPSKPPKSDPPPEPDPEPDAVVVKAGKMLEEFEGNEAAADAKYKGQVVEVTGNVAKVDTEFFDDDQYVIMLDGGDPYAFLSVNCNDVSGDVAAKVKAKSTITVRGEFDDGGDLGIEIKNCDVV